MAVAQQTTGYGKGVMRFEGAWILRHDTVCLNIGTDSEHDMGRTCQRSVNLATLPLEHMRGRDTHSK